MKNSRKIKVLVKTLDDLKRLRIRHIKPGDSANMPVPDVESGFNPVYKVQVTNLTLVMLNHREFAVLFTDTKDSVIGRFFLQKPIKLTKKDLENLVMSVVNGTGDFDITVEELGKALMKKGVEIIR